jgi:tetratricopeptide (TPR) repeat protein
MTAPGDADFDHAEACLEILQELDEQFRCGGPGATEAVQDFDDYRSQFEKAQAWCARPAGGGAQALCAAFGVAGAALLELRLPPRQRLTWYADAASAARRQDNGVAAAWALVNGGTALADLGATATALKELRAALALTKPTAGSPDVEMAARGALGRVHADRGEYDQAADEYRRQLALAAAAHDVRAQAKALGGLGDVSAAMGDLGDATRSQVRRLALARQGGDRRDEAEALAALGRLSTALRDPEAAVTFHARAAAVARDLGDQRLQARTLADLGGAHLALGDRDRAAGLLREAVRQCRELGDRRGEGQALCQLGHAYRLQRKWARSRLCFRLAVRATGDAPVGVAAIEGLSLARYERGLRVRALLAGQAALRGAVALAEGRRLEPAALLALLSEIDEGTIQVRYPDAVKVPGVVRLVERLELWRDEEQRTSLDGLAGRLLYGAVLALLGPFLFVAVLGRWFLFRPGPRWATRVREFVLPALGDQRRLPPLEVPAWPALVIARWLTGLAPRLGELAHQLRARRRRKQR